MTLFSHRRTLLAGLFMSTLLMLLARPITVLWLALSEVPRFASVPATVSTPRTPAPRTPAPAAHAELPATPDIENTPAPAVHASRLSLRSVLRDYDYTFEGRVTCGGEPCAAALEIVINTDQNPDLRQQVSLAADGTFRTQVRITEAARSQIDWRLIAREPNSLEADARGRQILMDEQHVDVYRDIDLHRAL